MKKFLLLAVLIGLFFIVLWETAKVYIFFTGVIFIFTAIAFLIRLYYYKAYRKAKGK